MYIKIILFIFIIFSQISCQKNINKNSPALKAKIFLLNCQNEDGSWDPIKYGGNFEHPDGKIAISALAGASLVEFNDQNSILACQKTLNFLMSNQKKDGSIGERNYANGICLFFLSKLMAAGRKIDQKAFYLLFSNILAKQSDIGAWDYTEANTDRNDMSISAWVCLGLNILSTQEEYAKEAKKSLLKINEMLNQDKQGAGDESNQTKALGAYTYGEDPNSPAGKVMRAPGTTVQAIILFIKSTLKEFRQSNWIEIAKKDQMKALSGRTNLSIYQTFFILNSKRNGIKYDSEYLTLTQKQLGQEQQKDGSWPLNSPPIQFGGKIMATAIGLIILQELSNK